MPDATILNMAEANAAYQAALNALSAVHAQQAVLIAANPVDWNAYNAALSAATSGQNAAQQALSVYQASILNTLSVTKLIVQIQAATATITQRTQALKAQATALNDLATAADTVTQILASIAQFVAI